MAAGSPCPHTSLSTKITGSYFQLYIDTHWRRPCVAIIGGPSVTALYTFDRVFTLQQKVAFTPPGLVKANARNQYPPSSGPVV